MAKLFHLNECSTKKLMDDKIVVVGMADEGECEKVMFVSIRWGKNDLGVPLVQLMPVSSVSAATKEAVDDWHYWVRKGISVVLNITILVITLSDRTQRS